MTFTTAQPNDSSNVPISSVYSTEGNTFSALASEQGAYVDTSNNQSSAALMSFLHPRVVQSGHAVTGSGGKTLTYAFSNPNIAGNSIVVSLGMGQVEAANITLSVTDSNSNGIGGTYTECIKASQSTTLEAAIFLATNIKVGSNTITITIAGSSSSNEAIAVECYEVWGFIQLSGALDQTSTGSAASGTTVTTGALSPMVPNELAFMAVASAGGTITAGSGWASDTVGTLSPTGGNLVSFEAQSQTLTAIASITPSATLGTSSAWAACCATFKSVSVPIQGTVTAIMQAVAGTALSADQNNTELRTSMYGKSSTAGDTALHVNSSGDQYVLGNFTEMASLSAGGLSADLVPSTDVSAYRCGVVHITGTYSGVLTFTCSNDNTNFVDVQFYNIATASANNAGYSTASSGVMLAVPISFRYFRVRMTAYTSGSATGTLELYTTPPPLILSTISSLQSGAWTVQPGNTPNTTPWLVTGSNNNGVQAANTAGNVVIKGSAGLLQGAMITATGTVGLTVYDNATTNSGTPVLVIPANPTVGQLYPVNGWCKNGIVSAGVTNCPGVTFFFA